MTEPNLVPDLIRKITDLERRLYELERRRIPAGGGGGDLWSIYGAGNAAMSPDPNATTGVTILHLEPGGHSGVGFIEIVDTGTPGSSLIQIQSFGEIDVQTGTGWTSDFNLTSHNDVNVRADNDINLGPGSNHDVNIGGQSGSGNANFGVNGSGATSLGHHLEFVEFQGPGGGYGPYSTLGTIVGRLPVYEAGAIVGYVPIYNTIT